MSAERIITVQGALDPGDLGITLPHEHLFLHLDNWLSPARNAQEEAFADEAVSLETLTQLRYRPYSNKDNIRIDDDDTVRDEVAAFAEAGGGTIVDVTPPAIGRDPNRIRRIAEATGVNIVVGSGYYVASSHPPTVADMSPDDVAEEVTQELQIGIDDSGVRAGVIGEVGTSFPIHPDEHKVLVGLARAQRLTGAPVSIHLSSSADYGHDVLDILEQGGANLEKVVIGHLDGHHPIDVRLHESIADRGAFVEYDLFGVTEFSEDGHWQPPPGDLERIDAIRSLWESDHGMNLLLSHDVCTKVQQRAHGGFGFAHLPGHVAPLMRTVGFSDEQVGTMLRSNPARWLAWEQPGD